MTRTFAPVSLLLLLSGVGFAQTPPSQAPLSQSGATLPTFDLADVHRSTRPLTQAIRVLGAQPPVLRTSGRYELYSATMVDLIRTAYNVDADKVLSGPSWLESDRFDVIAKAPSGTSPEAAKMML